MAEAVRLGFEMMGQSPTELVVAGGGPPQPGDHEGAGRAPAHAGDHPPRTTAGAGDSIEAEAFAYLAARHRARAADQLSEDPREFRSR